MPNAFRKSSPRAHNEFSFIVALPGPAHEFFGSRKLRLAPQDYSPWTPRSDRLSGRSYPPASRHPRVLDLVGRNHGVQCHPERSEPASEVEGSAPRGLERVGRGSFASSHALRAPPGNENAPEAPAALTLFHRKLRMTFTLRKGLYPGVYPGEQ